MGGTELVVGSEGQTLLTQVDQYLAGRITLEDLRAWVLFHLQSIVDSGEAHAISLADFVDVGTVELGEEVVTLAEFRAAYELTRATWQTIGP